MENKRKKILIIGGLGTIGRILTNAFANTYNLTIVDLSPRENYPLGKYIQLDITDYSQIISKIPEHVDVIINLAGIPKQPNIVDYNKMNLMSDIYVKGSYNVFLAATKLQIPKVIFASTNHVTDHYEKDGYSLLDREISIEDYPYSNSIYGTMKLCAENIGHVFSFNTDLSVICLRIGTVRENERESLLKDPRALRTILSHTDLIDLFKCAIETKIKFGIYYGVSDNPDKPWSIKNAIDEFGFRPRVNSNDLLRKIISKNKRIVKRGKC